MYCEYKFTQNDRYRMLGTAIGVLHAELIQAGEAGDDPADIAGAALACLAVLDRLAKEIERGE